MASEQAERLAAVVAEGYSGVEAFVRAGFTEAAAHCFRDDPWVYLRKAGVTMPEPEAVPVPDPAPEVAPEPEPAVEPEVEAPVVEVTTIEDGGPVYAPAYPDTFGETEPPPAVTYMAVTTHRRGRPPKNR